MKVFSKSKYDNFPRFLFAESTISLRLHFESMIHNTTVQNIQVCSIHPPL